METADDSQRKCASCVFHLLCSYLFCSICFLISYMFANIEVRESVRYSSMKNIDPAKNASTFSRRGPQKIAPNYGPAGLGSSC